MDSLRRINDSIICLIGAIFMLICFWLKEHGIPNDDNNIEFPC